MASATGADVFMTFGADTGALEAGLAAVKAKMNALARDMRQMSTEFTKTGAAADSDLGQKMRALGAEITAVKGKSRELTQALSPLAEGGAHGAGTGFYVREARALFDELSSGRAHQAVGTASNLFFTFASAAPALAGAVAAFAATSAAIGYFVYEAIEGRRVFEQFKDSLATGGHVAMSDVEIRGVTDALHAMSGVSNDDAEKIAASWGLMRHGSRVVFQAMMADVEQFAHVTGQEAPKAAESLKKMFEDPQSAGKALGDTFGGLTQAEQDSIDVANKSIDPLQAQAAIQQILADRLGATRKARIAEIDAQIAQTQAWKAQMADRPVGFTMGAPENRNIDALEQERQKLVELNAEARNQAQAMSSARAPIEAITQRMHDLVDASLPWAKALTDANTAIAQIKSGLTAVQIGTQGATSDAAAMIANFEKFRPTAYWDHSPGHSEQDHWAVGYGQHTMDGKEVTQASTTTQEAAQADMAAKIASIQANLESQIGASWARLSGAAKASLTDMAYNYGDLAKKKPGVISAAAAGNESGIADQMVRSAGDNGGVNAARRMSEANNIRNAGAAPAQGPNPSLAKDAAAAEAELADKAQKARDQMAGGNAVAQAQAQILARNAAGQKDSVHDARDMVTAWQEVLKTSHSQQSQIEAQNGLHRAQVTLAEKLLAVEKSRNALAAKDAVTAKDKLTAANAAANLAYTAAGGDAAAQNAALAEKKAAQATYDAEVLKMAQERENSEYQIAKAAIEQRKGVEKGEVASHDLIGQQKLAADLKLQADEEALDTQHAKRLRDLQSQGTLEYQKEQDKLTQIAAQGAAQRDTITAADNAKVLESYKRTFESIGNTVSSSIMGMIQGTETFGQMMYKVATQILKTFIDMGVKMVADWMATQARNLVLAATGQQGITMEWLTGNAIRTASDAGAAASGAATQLAAKTVSVTASAGQAGAGVAAFLAPLIGPAAIPAGAAAVGETAAIGMMDIGAWSIPQDQLAMVHKNELVMPAAEAGAFRSMLSGAASGAGAAGGSGAAGGDTHVHLNVSALDASSVKNWMGNNSRQIMQAMHQALRNGDHIGIRKLGQA